MYLFGQGLITCKKCSGKYIGKKQRDKTIYVCNTTNKFGNEKCKRFVIEEEYLIYAITKHVEIQERVVDKSLRDYIKSIEVDSNGYRIYYKDKSIAIFEQDRVKF